MYPNSYVVSNNTRFQNPNSNFSNDNIQWVKREDRFGGSTWVPLLVGGAVGYAIGNNNNNNNNFRPCCGPFFPAPSPFFWGMPNNNNFFF